MGDWHLDHWGILEVTFVRGAILILKNTLLLYNNENYISNNMSFINVMQ